MNVRHALERLLQSQNELVLLADGYYQIPTTTCSPALPPDVWNGSALRIGGPYVWLRLLSALPELPTIVEMHCAHVEWLGQKNWREGAA